MPDIIASTLVSLLLKQLEAGATAIDWKVIETQVDQYIQGHAPGCLVKTATYLANQAIDNLPALVAAELRPGSELVALVSTGNWLSAWKALAAVVS